MGLYEYKQVMNTLKQGRRADTLKKKKKKKKAENREKLEILPVGEGEKQEQLRPKTEK